MMPLVCVILVNYNGYSDTRECVESLRRCFYKNIKIIIVDNASLYDLVQYDEIITKDFCEIIYLDNNIGFAGGNNIGFECAKKYNPDYCLLLNNDTIVKPDFLYPLIECAEADNNTGIVTGKILNYYDKNEIWYGGAYYDEKNGEHKIKGIGEKDSARYNQKCKVEFATGCMWFIPYKVINVIGNMSEEYFLYYEDADYCEKIRKNGYTIYYLPESIIYHKESKSTGKGSDLYQYYNNRNYLRFVKNCHKTKRFRLYFQRATRMLKGVLRGNLKVRVCAEVWKDFLLNKSGKSSSVCGEKI